MRSIYESLSQHAAADQQHVSIQKKPSKWDGSAGTSLHHGQSDVDADHELVHGSSTVFVIEDELPPPAFTRNIVAKFRELEASNVDKSVPLPGKLSSTPSRSTHSHGGHSENRSTQSLTTQAASESRSTVDDDMTDGSEPARRQSGEERGRSEKRSEVRHRESSSSPGWSVASELPQQGTARSLLSRWRTIEKQASSTSDSAPRRSSAAAKRSQSTSRMEVRRHLRASQPPPSDDDDDDGQSARYYAI